VHKNLESVHSLYPQRYSTTMAMFHAFQTPSPSSSSNDWMPKRIEWPKPDIDLTERVACVAHIQDDVTYLWPAVIYENYKELQLHLSDQLTRKDTLHISFRLMYLAQQRKTTHVARLLGKPPSDGVQFVEVDGGQIVSYAEAVPALMRGIHDEDIFDKQSPASLSLYLQFATALDEAVAIMVATAPDHHQTLKSWLEIAQQEADKAKCASLPPSEPKEILKTIEPLKMAAVDKTVMQDDPEEMMEDSKPRALQVEKNQDTPQTFERASPNKEQVTPVGRPKSQLKTPLNLDKKFQEQKGVEEDDQDNNHKRDAEEDSFATPTPYKKGHIAAAESLQGNDERPETPLAALKKSRRATHTAPTAAVALESEPTTPESSSQGSNDAEAATPTSPVRHRMFSTATVVSVSESSATGCAAEDGDVLRTAGIRRTDSFDTVWTQLQFQGWTVQKPCGKDEILWYLQVGKSLDTGNIGVDYFDREGLEEWLQLYGWEGPRSRRSSPKVQNEQEENPETSTDKKKKSTTKKRKSSSDNDSVSVKQATTKNRKNSVDIQKQQEENPETKTDRKKQAITKKRKSSFDNDSVSGKQTITKDRKNSVDISKNRKNSVDISPVSSRPQRSCQAKKPKEGEEADADLPKKFVRPAKSDFYRFFNIFYDVLKPQEGWHYLKSPVSISNYIYCIPNKNENGRTAKPLVDFFLSEATHLVDYFLSEEEVEEYCMVNNYKQKYAGGNEESEVEECYNLDEEATEEEVTEDLSMGLNVDPKEEVTKQTPTDLNCEEEVTEEESIDLNVDPKEEVTKQTPTDLNCEEEVTEEESMDLNVDPKEEVTKQTPTDLNCEEEVTEDSSMGLNVDPKEEVTKQTPADLNCEEEVTEEESMDLNVDPKEEVTKQTPTDWNCEEEAIEESSIDLNIDPKGEVTKQTPADLNCEEQVTEDSSMGLNVDPKEEVTKQTLMDWNCDQEETEESFTDLNVDPKEDVTKQMPMDLNCEEEVTKESFTDLNVDPKEDVTKQMPTDWNCDPKYATPLPAARVLEEVTKASPTDSSKQMASSGRKANNRPRPCRGDFYHFKTLWADFLKSEAWRHLFSRHHDGWVYCRPNCNERTGTHLVDYFLEEEEVEVYCRANKYKQKYTGANESEVEECYDTEEEESSFDWRVDPKEEVSEQTPTDLNFDPKYVTPPPAARVLEPN
jgi:hypothetical protein